jgi:hypothetical protein
MRFVCLVFALSLTLSSYAVAADTTILDFSKVNDSLYRGGRPKPGRSELPAEPERAYGHRPSRW